MKNVRVLYSPRSRSDNIEKKTLYSLFTCIIIIHNFSQQIISNYALSGHYPKIPRLIRSLVSRDHNINIVESANEVNTKHIGLGKVRIGCHRFQNLF